MSTPQEIVENAIAEHKVVVFSKSWCPYCKATKALFAEHFHDETPFIVELDERKDGEDIQQYLLTKTGQSSVPNIFINKEHVGGNDKAQAKYKNGELKRLVNL
ncbi:putative grx1-glutaredoxin [Mycena kentingensis (nom. inval.)]|nr:putative grx1-glutaredoxin [Mycena kentingensis (nom. inval.)]